MAVKVQTEENKQSMFTQTVSSSEGEKNPTCFTYSKGKRDKILLIENLRLFIIRFWPDHA